MSYLSSVILGLIQGVAEFLPISSSGHLAIAQAFLGFDNEIPEFFDVLLHLGTLLAVFVAFWKDIWGMILEFFRGIRDIANHSTPKNVPSARRLLLLVILGSIPLALVLPVHKKIEALSCNMVFVGVALVFTGVVLMLSDIVRRGNKTERSASVGSVLIVGVAQALATMPGISRSGMTIAAGSFLGYDRRFAVRLSFLLSIPAVLGANFLTLIDALKAGIDWAELPIYLVGVVTAAVSGYLCLRLLKMIAEKGRFGGFAYYCWFMGLLTLFLNTVK